MSERDRPKTSTNICFAQADVRLLDSCIDRIIFVARGHEIYDSATRLHILKDGWAYKYKLLPDGRRQIFALYLSGDVCDLEGIFLKNPKFGVRASSDCRVGEIPLDWLKVAIDEQPAVRDLFWSLTVLENVAIAELATSLGSRSAQARVAWFLCDLVMRLEMRGKMLKGRFRMEITQSDMADTLGLSLVHVNRTLQALRTAGLISTRGSAYTILNDAGLRTAAGYGADIGTPITVPSPAAIAPPD